MHRYFHTFSGHKIILSCALIMQTCAVAAFGEEENQSVAEEALFVRRIAASWEQGEYDNAKQQILSFFEQYKGSDVEDHLYAMLGDLYYRENNFQLAINAYEKIAEASFQDKVSGNLIQSYFELKQDAQVEKMAQHYLLSGKKLATDADAQIRFLYAESLFRRMIDEKNASAKQKLALEANILYKELESSKYGTYTLFPLAETSRTLQHYPEAVSYYFAAAEKYPQKKEELWFRAANLELKYDKAKAAATFKKIIDLKGEKASLAAYNYMSLLFEMERYGDLILAQEQCMPLIGKEYQGTVEYYLGKGYYILGNYSNAASYLDHYLITANASSPEFRNALIMLMESAQKTENLLFLDKVVYLLQTKLPHDALYPQALLIHAQASLKGDDVASALNNLQILLKDYPDHANREMVLYNYAILLSRTAAWEKSREALVQFVKQFPASPNANNAYRSLINCSLQMLKAAPSESIAQRKELLIGDLKTALAAKGALDADEEREYRLVLVKTLYELREFGSVEEQLNTYLADYPHHPSFKEAQMMMTSCQHKLQASSLEFIASAEKSLSFNPAASEKKKLHLQLYNAYLLESRANKLYASSEKAQELLAKAADHLFQAWVLDESKVKPENHAWLADYYYLESKRDPSQTMAVSRAVRLFEKLLGIETALSFASELQVESSLSFALEQLPMESAALKLADLFALQKDTQRQLILLEGLTVTQAKHPQAGWKFQRRALFELGKAYEAVAQSEKALKVYSLLMQASSTSPSFFSKAATLQHARLQYSMLSEAQRNETDPQFAEIVAQLKDLQLTKKMYSEPMHLESALDYVEMVSEAAPSEVKIERSINLLKQVHEDFSSQENLVSREYQLSGADYPQQERVSKAYLKFVQAEILRLEAVKARNKHELMGAIQMEIEAAVQFKELLQDSEALTPYLKAKIAKSMDQLKTNTL